jgi:hypothetical protein
MTFDHDSPGPDHAATYSYRPSLLGAPREFAMGERGLLWRAGPYSGEVPYHQVRRIRMSFRPMTIQTYRFITEIWPKAGPKLEIASTSWRGMIQQERHDAPYAAFVTELNRRIGAGKGETLFVSGTNPIQYWIGLAVFLVVLLAVSALLVKALIAWSLVPAMVVGGLLALFLLQTGGYFRRNRPRRYQPDAIPPEVLPRAS